MIKKVELQVHSDYSDGSYSPSELFKMAKKAGISILSIADHDSVEGVPEAFKAAQFYNISYISGIELTVVYQKKELHLLGYGIDYKNPHLQKLIVFSRKARVEQTRKIVVKLKELGYQVSFAKIKKRAKNIVSRPHVADEIIAHPKNKILFKKRHGFFPNRSLFIKTYIIPGKTGFVRKNYIPIKEGIKAIHRASGLSFLAHPLSRRYSEGINLTSFPNWQKVIFQLKKLGLNGIEVFAPGHFFQDQQILLHFAKKHNFLITGGSDFHNLKIPGLPLGHISRTRPIPYWVGNNLLKKANPKFTFLAK